MLPLGTQNEKSPGTELAGVISAFNPELTTHRLTAAGQKFQGALSGADWQVPILHLVTVGEVIDRGMGVTTQAPLGCWGSP